MRSHRGGGRGSVVGLVALGVVLAPVACSPTGGQPPDLAVAPADEPSTSPPEPLTTSHPSPSPTSRRGYELWRIDPSTLEPTERVSAEPVGWHVWSVVAADGAVALVAETDLAPGVSRWALTIIELADASQTEVTSDSGLFPEALAFHEDTGDLLWVMRDAGSGNFSKGFTVRSYDRDTGLTTDLLEFDAGRLSLERARFLDGGRRLGVFGTEDPEHVNLPRAVVLDLASGATVADVLLDTEPPVTDEDRYGWVVPAWDELGERLYVPHLTDDAVTTVDFSVEPVTTTRLASAGSPWAWLRDLWLPAAHAKGRSHSALASLSADGELLYLTGNRIEERDEGDFRFTDDIPNGIRVLDADDLRELARTDLPLSDLRLLAGRDVLLATGAWEHERLSGAIEFGAAGVYLLDRHDLEIVRHIAPGSVDSMYELASSPDGRFGYAILSRGHPSILVVDADSEEVTEVAVSTRRLYDRHLLELGLVLRRVR